MIQKLIEFIAPDECLVCTKEGQCICELCRAEALVVKKPACVLCNAFNPTGKTCQRCKSKTKLSGASVAYRYDGVVKELIHQMKYQNRRSVARFFAGLLPTPIYYQAVVSFVPSDGPARRARGYDQAELLAKEYAKLHQLEFRKLLIRTRHTKQVGHKRTERFVNVKDNFQLRSINLGGRPVLLVDDVVTTGATISECAAVLRSAGAKQVWALGVAKK